MNRGPIFDYRALVGSGALSPDPAQLLAAEKLQLLHTRLQGYRPGRDKGGLRGLIRISRPDPAPQGLYIFGDVGRGKSMLMDLFFETAAPAAKTRVHFYAFMNRVHGAIHQWRQQRRAGTAQGDDPLAPVAAKIARKATLLCFDEFQVTDVADAMILKRLFEYLFEAGVVLVATSNTAPEDLYAHGLNRPLFLPFIGLLNQRMDVLHLAGARDFRRGRGAADDRYFSPLGPNATQAMDAAWAHTSAGLPVGPVPLSVAGRPLLVPLAAGRAARFSFAQLCLAPLGAGDYQILAENFDRIFIDDIPSLTDAGRNVVARVIAMIDTFYETGIELCVSAAVQPDFLYANGRDAGRFARAASRLQEMRAPGYPPDRLAANNRNIRQTGVPGATT